MLTPADSSSAPRSVVSAAGGLADFGTVPAGSNVLEASRWLSAAERAELPPGQDVTGWAVRTRVTVGAGSGPAVVAVPASHRRSLVISEWAFNIAGIPGIGAYPYGGFLDP